MIINPFGSSSGSSGGIVTWSPTDKHADIALSGSNYIASKTGTNASRSVRASFGRPDTDNGYFEVYMTLVGGGTPGLSPFRIVGLSNWSVGSADLAGFPGDDANSWGYYEQTGQKYTNNIASAYGAAYADNDTIGVAFKNGKVWFAKNNVWQGGGDPAAGTGEAFSGLTGTLYPTTSLYLSSLPRHVVHWRPAAAQCVYTPPSGFLYWER